MATPASGQDSSAGIVVVGRVLTGLLIIGLLMALTRLLDKQTFGAFFIIYTIYEALAALGTLGLPASMLYFIPRADPADCRRIGWGTGLTLLVCALPWTLALVGLAGPIARISDRPEIFRLLPYLGAFVLLDFPSQMLANYLLGRRRYAASVLAGLVFNAVLVVALVVPAALGWSLEGLMRSFVAAGLFRLVSFAAYFLLVEREGSLRPDPATLREQIRFGFPLFLNNLTAKLNRYLDKYFIMFAFAAEVFAVYSVASQELPLVGMLPYALTSAIMPTLVLHFREDDRDAFLGLWHGSMEKMAVIMLPIAAFFLVTATDFLTVAFTAAYAPGALVFRIYLLLLPLRLCSYGGVVQTTGATRHVLFGSLLSFGVNMALNWPLLELWGMPGPAVASVVAQVVAVVYLVGAIRGRLGVGWGRVFPLGALLRPGAVAALAALPLLWLVTSGLAPGWRLLLAAALYLPCYLALALWTGAISRADLRYLVRMWRPRA